METLTKPELQTMDRLRQTIAAQARLLDETMNEMRALDAEIQERILMAAQEMEESCEQQAAERLRLAVEEAEENTRIIVTEELQDRFKKKLTADIEAARKEWQAERTLITEELDRFKHAAKDWIEERTKLVADCQAATQLLDELREEHSRALAETDEAASIALERQIKTAVERVRTESEARWNAERAELAGGRDQALQKLAQGNAEHQDEMLLVQRFRTEITEERDRLRRALEQATNSSVEFESECERLREENEHARKLLAESTAEHRGKKAGADLKAQHAEVARVEGLIHDITRIIEDPATELSVVIRKNAERAELESYLRGIRFSLPPSK